MVHAIPEATPSGPTPGPTSGDQIAWLQAVARHGDKTAFEALFRYFAPRIKSYVLRLGADAGAAEDLAQEAMVQVWRKAALYDSLKATPSAWIFALARNLRIDRLRRQRFYEVELSLDAELADNGADATMAQLDAARLTGCLDAVLPLDQLDVVRLAFFEDLTHPEIGERLGVPLGTVKSRLRLAFAKLRIALSGER
jgi:RNA polymerase sigma-70 factor (ECF subfamily)